MGAAAASEKAWRLKRYITFTQFRECCLVRPELLMPIVIMDKYLRETLMMQRPGRRRWDDSYTSSLVDKLNIDFKNSAKSQKELRKRLKHENEKRRKLEEE